MRFLGKKTVMVYLGMISVCSIVFGILLDSIYMSLGIQAAVIVGSGGDIVPYYMQCLFAFILLPIMIYGVIRNKLPDFLNREKL
jgi:hypothetical protein